MTKQCWLVKQEPESWSWEDFEREGETAWSGIRNFQARNNLRAMKRGDLVLFYHSVSEKRIVGIARVTREAYPDPTATEGDWSCVDLKPVKRLKHPVSLSTIKQDPVFKDFLLIRHSRLSVMPVTPQQFERVQEIANTND